MNLPELPSPHNIINGVWYYTADQLRAYAEEAVKQERERSEPTEDQIIEAMRPFAADGGRWPSDWIDAARAVLAIRGRSRTAVPAKE